MTSFEAFDKAQEILNKHNQKFRKLGLYCDIDTRKAHSLIGSPISVYNSSIFICGVYTSDYRKFTQRQSHDWEYHVAYCKSKNYLPMKISRFLQNKESVISKNYDI